MDNAYQVYLLHKKRAYPPGKLFATLKEEADFNLVPSRAIQAATLKALNGDKTDGGSKPSKSGSAEITINTVTGTGNTGSYPNKK